MSAIHFNDLTLGYDRHPVVHHLDGEVRSGELLAIVGPNGAGKSTLLKGIAGALAPLSGSVGVNRKATRIAYLPQAADVDRKFPISVYDVVSMGLWRRTGWLGGVGRQDRAAIEHAIAAVGLTGFEDRAIGALSGGQMQRALFARLLLQDAGVILLDEPLTAIDAKTAADLLDLVRRWHAEERTVVAVLHDFEVVKSVFPQTLLVAREAVAWGASTDVLTPDNLMKARRMLEAPDRAAERCPRAA